VSGEFLCAQVRRDLKLLLGAGLAEVLNAVFPVLACRKPANTILVPAKSVIVFTILTDFTFYHYLINWLVWIFT